MKYKLIFIIFAVVLLFGCSIEDDTRSAKQKAEDSLLQELKICSSKFGGDSSERRQLSAEYCNKVLGMFNDLIEDGYFNDETKRKSEELNISNVKVNEEIEDVYDSLETIKDDIMGDI